MAFIKRWAINEEKPTIRRTATGTNVVLPGTLSGKVVVYLPEHPTAFYVENCGESFDAVFERGDSFAATALVDTLRDAPLPVRGFALETFSALLERDGRATWSEYISLVRDPASAARLSQSAGQAAHNLRVTLERLGADVASVAATAANALQSAAANRNGSALMARTPSGILRMANYATHSAAAAALSALADATDSRAPRPAKRIGVRRFAAITAMTIVAVLGGLYLLGSYELRHGIAAGSGDWATGLNRSGTHYAANR